MATSTFACSSSLPTILSHDKSAHTLSLSRTTALPFLSPHPHSIIKLSNTHFSKPMSSIVARVTETEEAPAVVEVEATEVKREKDTTPLMAKGEEVFAVVMIGGRQYMVFPGRFLYTQRLKGANVNDKIILNKVLLVGTKAGAYIGMPVVPNAVVHAVVEEQGLNDKVIVFKYKKKKNYRRKIGHRQPNTRIKILGISGYEDSPLSTLPPELL